MALQTAAARLKFARLWPIVLCLLSVGTPVLAETTHHVLVLYPYGRVLPGYVEADRGLQAEFVARPDMPVALSVESLDSPRFEGESHERIFAAYLREKYAQQPPEVILAGAEESLEFLVRHRDELFPGVPIVHMGVGLLHLRSLGPLPPGIVGTPANFDFVGTVEQAKRWHPGARRLVVLTGSSSWDRRWEAELRAQADRLPSGLEVNFVAGLPIEETLRFVRNLPRDSIIYTPGYMEGGGGFQWSPREIVRAIAAASSSPVYIPVSSLLGTGAVGGRMATYDTMARVGARTAIALLEGTPPEALKLPTELPAQLHVDWRELQRWGVPDRAVPADAVLHFREPTLWEAYRNQTLVGVAVMLLQAGLIIALLLARRARRRTMDALARSEESMRLAARAAGLSTWVHEDEAAPTNGRARRRGPAHPEIPDLRDMLARIAPQDRAAVTAALRQAHETNGEFEVEYRTESPEGEWRWYVARGRPDPLHSGRLLGITIEITQRKRSQLQAEQDRAALQHLTRVSLLGQLSASIAHQLNQPLAAILGNAEAAQKMLERTPVDVTELREICADIVAADHHAAQVIRRLGALFKRGEPAFEQLDLNELVSDTLELTRSMLTIRHVAVATQLSPGLPRFAGDRVQLQQLVLNLVVNACDAVAGLPEDRRLVTISTSLQGGAVQLCVTDSGPGVPPEAMNKLFEPFWSTRAGGMGMGLAVCRTVTDAHRGSLTVRNTDEGGAQFCVRLPVQGPT